jgi:inositol phosphorylceramide mannosyltransferase catalytic subunit
VKTEARDTVMFIPKIIHQTWRSEALPQEFRVFQESWLRRHRGWEYRFYDDEACRRFVLGHFPELLQLYEACPHPVQRADLFRYLVVDHEGGLYADMDVECLRNMEGVLGGKHAVFGVEDRLSPRQRSLLNHRYPERIANFIFAAEPKHPVFAMIIESVKIRSCALDMEKEILETTGPGMLTDVVQDHRGNLGLTVLPRICWAPPSWYPDCFPFNLHMFARHHFSGTWKEEQPGSAREVSFQAGLRLRELYYRLPPSPLWKRDFLPLRRRGVNRTIENE